MMPRHLAVAFVLAAAMSAPARAQEDDPNASPIYVETDEAEPLLKQAADAETAGHWDLAVDKYARVLREHPDSMTVDPKDPKMWRSVRRHVFERISKFPEAGLAAYMAANDAVAKSLYEQALKEGGNGLDRVVNDYFFTSVGDDAAVRLADSCAEQGRLEDALHYWDLAARLYPNPDVPMPPLLAKWAAACRRAGDDVGWAEAKSRLEALGDAPLTIAGKKVTAKESIAVLEKVQPARMRTDRGTDWPRIGGNNSGTRISDSKSRNDVRLWSFPPTWTSEKLTAHLNQARQAQMQRQPPAPFLQSSPAVGPGGEVVIADGVSVWAMSLEDGRELWVEPKGSDPEKVFIQAMAGQPRVMSLVAPVIADGRVYVNFLPRQVNMGANNDPTSLAAYSLDKGIQLWTTATDTELQNAWFGSPPVVYGGRVYAAVTSSGQVAPTAELVVLDAETGRLLRKVFLCEYRRANPGWGAWTITEAPVIAESGGILFINTNIGAIAAVQAATSEVLWLAEYEANAVKVPNRRFPQPDNTRNGRGLSPIVVLGNRVCFVAGDSDNYMEFDARNGAKLLSVPARLVTKDKTGDPVRWFVGIRDERAWFQGEKYAFAMDLSKIDRTKPVPDEVVPNSLTAGSLQVRVAGRGFLTADKFYLPLDAGINVYESRNFKLFFDAKWQDDTKSVDAGTILLVGDRMLTLSAAGITCFTDRETFDKGYADVLNSATPDLAKLERHAEVLARNPTTYSGAITDYEKIASAATADTVRVTRAKTRIMELHLTLGDAAKRSGALDKAIEHYAAAVAAAPAEARLGDVFRDLGDCLEKLGRWKEAVAVYQDVIEKYGEKLLVTEAGLARPVRQFAEDKIREIVLEHGLDLYEDVEKRAKELLEKLKEKGTADELRKLWENFPNSSSAGAAASLLADRLEAEDRLSEAGLALLEVARRPEAVAGSGALVARAGELFARARAWERLEGAASRLERCHAAATVKIAGKDVTGAEAAAALRTLRPSVASAAERPGPSPWREWLTADADKVRVARDVVAKDPGPTLVVPEGAWTGLDPSRIFFVQRAAVLEAHDAEKDVPVWTSVDPRGYLGAKFDSTSDGSTQLSKLVQGGPADRGGVVEGDIAEQWNGEVLRSQDQLRRLVCAGPGKEVQLVVRRNGKAFTLKVTIGRRDADNDPAEPAERLVFADGGLLLVVRASSVQAVRPATGETVWVHCPVYSRFAHLTRAAASDGRLFLSWAPGPGASAGQPNPNERDVSLEAIDAATGRPLWLYRESNSDVTDLFAVSGSGLVVRCERRGVSGHLRLIDAATGVEKRDLTAAPIPNSPRIAAAVDGGQLLFLREANLLASYDLFTNAEVSRELGGQKGIPDAFAAGGGRAAMAYAATRRVILSSANPVQPRFTGPLPDGLPDPAGLGFGSDGVLYVATRSGQAGDRPASVLRKFSVDGTDLKQQWKVLLASGNSQEGLVGSGPGFVLTWAGNSKDPVAATVRCWQPKSGKLLWEVEPAMNPAGGGPLRRAGEQGGAIWVQFDGRLLLFR